MAFRDQRNEEEESQQGQASGEVAGNRAMRRMQRREESRRPTGPEQRRRPAPPTKRERTSPREFSREVRAELRKVAWPSRSEVVNSTIIVLIAVIFLTTLIFGYDFAFGKFVLFLYD
ncbi:MAG TPA: preprotein translocase subunit SecE [Acidimicrobiia bacterium]|nr:preprotein translocase subunit SecE [Acidimicrobiia bacterium]